MASIWRGGKYPTVTDRVKPRRMHRCREPRDQGQGIHLDRDRAIAKGLLQLHGYQAFVGHGDMLLGDGWPQHVLEKVRPADIVLGAGTRGCMERESSG